MIARALRLAIVLAIVAALLLLFFYAFVAAVIVAPVIVVLFWLFGRRIETRFWTSRTARGGGRPSTGPVIDHDPDASTREVPKE